MSEQRNKDGLLKRVAENIGKSDLIPVLCYCGKHIGNKTRSVLIAKSSGAPKIEWFGCELLSIGLTRKSIASVNDVKNYGFDGAKYTGKHMYLNDERMKHSHNMCPECSEKLFVAELEFIAFDKKKKKDYEDRKEAKRLEEIERKSKEYVELENGERLSNVEKITMGTSWASFLLDDGSTLWTTERFKTNMEVSWAKSKKKYPKHTVIKDGEWF